MIEARRPIRGQLSMSQDRKKNKMNPAGWSQYLAQCLARSKRSINFSSPESMSGMTVPSATRVRKRYSYSHCWVCEAHSLLSIQLWKWSLGLQAGMEGQHPFLPNHNLAASAPPICRGLNRKGRLGVLSLCLIHTSDRFVHLEFDNH